MSNYPPMQTIYPQTEHGNCPECDAEVSIQRRRLKRVNKQWVHTFFGRCSAQCGKEDGERAHTEIQAMLNFLM